MNRLNTLKTEHIAIKKREELMNSINQTEVNGKAETEDLNYYFKIWLKKGRDNTNR